MIKYKTQGICAKEIYFSVKDNILQEVIFVGGCDGNHKGLCALVKGLPIDEVIAKLQSITCGGKETSCPDQLAQALITYKKVMVNNEQRL